MRVDVRALIGKLNRESRSAMEAAAGLCLSRTHYDVEIEHYVLKLLESKDGDFSFIIKQFELDRSRIASQLTEALDGLKRGNTRTPSLSPHLTRMFEEAWILGSVEFKAPRIRTGHTLMALVDVDDLRRRIIDSCPELGRIARQTLRQDLDSIVARSSEAAAPPMEDHEPEGRRAAVGDAPNLKQYATNLTQRAREGMLDPVLGREFEVRQIIDILTRRRQNNPILVGEAGVGKTAVAEGFAMRVVEDDVPPPLRGVEIYTLDLALLQAGAGVKGEFESRLKGLIQEVKSSVGPIILFIDEAHTMIGAGGAAGQGDAANLLKPALARGELRTIAATTWSEYKKYFEKDPALARRFQLVKVEEPSEDACAIMLRGIVPQLEEHHSVRILDDGLEAAVRLSHRYLPDRQLPDKAVSVLDTACARLSLGQNATPSAIEDLDRQLDDLAVQARVLERESASGLDHAARLAEIGALRGDLEGRVAALRERWEDERDLVNRVQTLRGRLEELALAEAEKTKPRGEAAAACLIVELESLRRELELLQGEDPLVPVAVDGELISRVVSGWTGIPVGKMLRDDISAALDLEGRLGTRIIGQDAALEAISRRIRTSKAGIEDPGKPVGVFLLVGPSGVGKTETALAVSDILYGGERNLITINMSEFQEAHTASTLKGSPPGYVGYGEGGVLTEAVRRRPYSVVLLDEVEKAHPDVLELFFQVFDKGVMEDGEGRSIDFKNTVVILTTNVGTETIMRSAERPGADLGTALKPELDRVFKPALLGRLAVVPYLPVRDEALERIVHLKLDRVRERVREAHGAGLTVEREVVEAIAERCTEVESGARNIDNILTHSLLPAISSLLLESLALAARPEAIRVFLNDSGELDCALDAGAELATPLELA